MTSILDRLQDDLLYKEISFDYEIWEGCYTDDEYDFRARYELSKRYPELDWTNPQHEYMLLSIAIRSHAPNWKPKYLEGGWTRERFCLDGLRDLFIYCDLYMKIGYTETDK